MPRISRPQRRGSALVIVLGVLAVLMLMAVAFSTFVRTERGGSTNLKNSFVARSSLDTALGRAMEAIDLAFGSADCDDPVAPWPYPWLASDGTGDHYQCAALGETETAGAHVLTTKISEYLTPAQLALVKSAKCDWAPIYSSISASRSNPSRSGHDWGNYGRPVQDSLVGRYAFIALDTTGLLDMNQTGINPAYRDSNSGNPSTFDPPGGDANDSDGTKIPPFVKNPDAFLDTRDSSKKFYSMADAKEQCAAGVLNPDIPTALGNYYPADLFAGFAPSLAELDPEGNPKIQIPRRSELPSLGTAGWTAFVRRTFRAMVAIFARGRVANGIGATVVENDQFPIFQNCGSGYSLSRAALATVALLDGLDADFVPGKSEAPITCNYWTYLRSQSGNLSARVTDKNGNDVTVSETIGGDGSYLNYPCTESAPLLSSVYASIEINPSATVSGSGNAQKKTYRGTLHIGARAICQNKDIKSGLDNDKITLEWEVMSGTPRANTVTGDNNSEDIRNGYVEMKAGSGFSSGKNIEWKDFFGASGTCPPAATTVSGRQLTIRQDIPFQIVCSFNPTDSKLVPYGGFYPPTQAEYNIETGDVFVPIRMKVTIRGDDGTIQQVPAPAIATSKDYWLRVSPAVYHGKASKFGGQKGGSPSSLGSPSFGSLGQLSWGWALCAVPAFGFDTGSLVTMPGTTPGQEMPVPTTMNFWINDIIARNAGGSGGFHGGGQVGVGRFNPFIKAFFLDSSANDQARREFIAGGFRDPIWNFAQFAWLFKSTDEPEMPTTPYGNVSKWMNKNEGRHLPDMLHCAKKSGSPFIEVGQSVSSSHLAAELYSRIPANGYGTAADLGTVMCGPYETLSLFRTWRYGGAQADFHPVVDYFTTDRDRYPDRKEITDVGTTSAGDVNWTKLGGGMSSEPYKDLYSAVHNGRVNLNAPPLVEASKVPNNGASVRGTPSDYLNPYPFAAVFNGAPYPGVKNGNDTTNTIDAQTALILATDLCRMLEDTTLKETKAESSVFNHTRNVIRNLSFLGAGDYGENSYKDRNKLLEDFITLAQPRDDNERESLIRGTIDGFTTRGQTYLVILRADAYTPKFGMNDNVRDGTTLATTHAIVELFRDPIPARAPDGSLPSDGQRPVAYHNWYVRSFRVF